MTGTGIGVDDVLLGRGGITNNHEGNLRFRTIVAKNQQGYLRAAKTDKCRIAQHIVDIVHRNGGRFLKKDEGSDVWIPVSNSRAREKASQALREGLIVRKGKLRPDRLIKNRCDLEAKDQKINEKRSNAISKPSSKQKRLEKAATPYVKENSVVNVKKASPKESTKHEPKIRWGFIPYSPPNMFKVGGYEF